MRKLLVIVRLFKNGLLMGWGMGCEKEGEKSESIGVLNDIKLLVTLYCIVRLLRMWVLLD